MPSIREAAVAAIADHVNVTSGKRAGIRVVPPFLARIQAILHPPGYTRLRDDTLPAATQPYREFRLSDLLDRRPEANSPCIPLPSDSRKK